MRASRSKRACFSQAAVASSERHTRLALRFRVPKSDCSAFKGYGQEGGKKWKRAAFAWGQTQNENGKRPLRSSNSARTQGKACAYGAPYSRLHPETLDITHKGYSHETPRPFSHGRAFAIRLFVQGQDLTIWRVLKARQPHKLFARATCAYNRKKEGPRLGTCDVQELAA